MRPSVLQGDATEPFRIFAGQTTYRKPPAVATTMTTDGGVRLFEDLQFHIQ